MRRWFSRKGRKASPGQLKNGVRVGAVNGNWRMLAPKARALVRVLLADDDQALEQSRNAINAVAAIDIVEDPLGVHHEAVPYEALTLVGPRELADGLKEVLPRYFEPLAYKRLQFEVCHVDFPNRSSLLFGDFLEAGLGGEAGSVAIVDDNGTTYPAHRPGEFDGSTFRLAMGQQRAVIAIVSDTASHGQDVATSGLPWIALPGVAEPMAIVMDADRQGPRVRLYRLNEPGAIGEPTPILGESLASARVSRNAGFEVFEARFDETINHLHGLAGRLIRIIPDQAYSRLLTQRRHAVDCLEVLGVFLPEPERVKGVDALSISLGSSFGLLGHGMDAVQARATFVGRRERRVHRLDRSPDRFSQRGAIPNVGLRVELARPFDSTVPKGWVALLATAGSPLGWLPLRLARYGQESNATVESSHPRLTRSTWVGPGDTGEYAGAVHLDWLDHCVSIVHQTPQDGPRISGLAAWCADALPAEFMDTSIRAPDGRLRLQRLSDDEKLMAEGKPFRFGLLWVRFHAADTANGQT